MIFIARVIKTIQVNDKLDVIRVNYSNKFSNNRNAKGRPVIDYDNLTDEELENKCLNKASQLIRKVHNINNLIELNEFKYFLTIHVNNKTQYTKLMNNLKQHDKDIKYLSLASWSIESNLHYHILINTKFSIDELYEKSKHLINNKDEALKNITDIQGLKWYFNEKNLKGDVIELLKKENTNKLSAEELRSKQIEILKHSKIVSYSKNLNKPIIKKYYDKLEDIEELKNAEYLETIQYNALGTLVQIDKFELNK